MANAYPPANYTNNIHEKMRAELADAQYVMCEALVRRNVNNIGRNAWSYFINQVQDMVVDYMNDTNNTQQIPSWNQAGKPNFIYTKTYNNSWDICYGYMTTCVQADQMENWYVLAAQTPPQNEPTLACNQRRKAKECAWTLPECLKEQVYHCCHGLAPYHCSLPNAKKTPDIVVGVIPNPNTHIKFPIFIFEVIGKKKITGINERHFPGFLEVMQSLTFAPYAYYGEVDDKSVYLFKFQKVPQDGCIDITYREFKYAVPGQIGAMLGRIMDALTEIFFDVITNLSWVQYESSRLLRAAGYQDFVAELNGQLQLIETHCWHLFEPTFVGQHHHVTQEKCPYDNEDNFTQIHPRSVIPTTLKGDQVHPVVSSEMSSQDAVNIYNAYKTTTTHAAFIRPVSRALRDYRDGNPLNPRQEANWVSVYNQFRVNRTMSTIRRTGGLLTRGLIQNMTSEEKRAFNENQHIQVHNMYNPGVRLPPANCRKRLQEATHNPAIVEEDFKVESEDEMESADSKNLSNIGLEPHLTYVQPPEHPVHTQPAPGGAVGGNTLHYLRIFISI